MGCFEFKLKHEIVTIPEARPVFKDDDDGRWNDDMFHPLIDIEEKRDWFLRNLSGIKGELAFMLSCLLDLRSIYALRYALDPGYRIICDLSELEFNDQLHFQQVEINSLKNRLERFSVR